MSATRTMPVPPDLGRAACSAPAHLPLVDAAMAKPGGPHGDTMREQLCRHCPVVDPCYAWAMAHGERGIWGGTSPGWRTRRGAPRNLPIVPRGLYLETARDGVPVQQHLRKASTPTPPAPAKPRSPNKASIRCAELGIREADVRQWAREHGLTTSSKGRVALHLVEAWAEAHGQAA